MSCPDTSCKYLICSDANYCRNWNCSPRLLLLLQLKTGFTIQKDIREGGSASNSVSILSGNKGNLLSRLNCLPVYLIELDEDSAATFPLSINASEIDSLRPSWAFVVNASLTILAPGILVFPQMCISFARHSRTVLFPEQETSDLKHCMGV